MPSGLRSSRLMLSASLSACRLSSVTWPSGSLTRTRSSAGTLLPAPTPRGAPSSSGDSSSSSSGGSAGRAEGTSQRPGGRIPGGPSAPRGGGETRLQSSPEVRGPVQGFPAVASSRGEMRVPPPPPMSPRRAANARGPRSATHPESRTAPPCACPRVAAAAAAQTPELPTLFSTFHSIPPPRHFLQKTETTRTCLKETAHLLALKGTAVAQKGAGLGTAAQPLCGGRWLSLGPSLPPRPVTG